MTIEDLEYGLSAGPDRTPPQDVDAERSVLGGMMISKDAIADVVEVLRGTDFYRPAHELVYEAVLDLYGRGEPADAITVSDELTKRGELARIGGAPYLHTLIATVPTAANAGYYARIVRERSILRRLVEAGTRITQLGYASDGGDVDELVNTAQAEVYAVTERRSSEDYVPLSEIIGDTVDEIEAAGHHGTGMKGVPTGFADLDRLTNGLHPGQMVVVAARPAIGKALALDTPLPTPTGWTTMGEVAVGDWLLAADGTPTEVVAATEVMAGRPCYRVVFDDGVRRSSPTCGTSGARAPAPSGGCRAPARGPSPPSSWRRRCGARRPTHGEPQCRERRATGAPRGRPAGGPVRARRLAGRRERCIGPVHQRRSRDRHGDRESRLRGRSVQRSR